MLNHALLDFLSLADEQVQRRMSKLFWPNSNFLRLALGNIQLHPSLWLLTVKEWICLDPIPTPFAGNFQVLYDDCAFPWQFSYFIGAHAVLFFILFSEFYIKAYIVPKPKKLKVGLSIRGPGKAIFVNLLVVSNSLTFVLTLPTRFLRQCNTWICLYPDLRTKKKITFQYVHLWSGTYFIYTYTN